MVPVTQDQEARLESASTVRVLIADDAWHYAQALAATLQLEPDIEVLAIAYSAEEAIRLAEEDGPDVVLLDLDLPEMGGVAACEALRDTHPRVAVVIVTALTGLEDARRSLAAGARGYVVKHDRHDPERIAAAVRMAARGDHLLDRDVHDLLQSLMASKSDPAAEAGLTAREVEVLPLVAEGLRNKEIALRLDLSEQTVKNHLNNIYRKLQASNRTQVTAEARRRGILP